MVGVQDGARVVDVEVVVALLAPGQVGNPVEVGAGDGVLATGGGHGLQAVELLGGHLLHVRRQPGLLQALLQLVELLLLLAHLAQLLLDGLELLAQVVLALGLRHLAFHGGVDLVGELENLPLAVEQLQDQLHPGLEVDRLQDGLLLLDGDIDVGGDEVRQVAGVVDGLHQLGGRRRQLWHQFNDFPGKLLEINPEGLHLDVLGGGLVLHRLHPGLQVGRLLHQFQDPEARQALHHQRVVVLAHLEQLDDAGHRAHGVQVIGARVLLLGAALGDDADDLVIAHRVLDEGDGLLTPHRQGKHAPREEDRVAQGQDGQHRRDVLLVHAARRHHRCSHRGGGLAALLLFIRH